jgi:hypothetical protein
MKMKKKRIKTQKKIKRKKRDKPKQHSTDPLRTGGFFKRMTGG